LGTKRALYILSYLTGVWREEFVERTKEELGIRARGRKIREMEGQFEFREAEVSYNGHFEAKKSDIRPENTYLW
jgi:hypothetical protein